MNKTKTIVFTGMMTAVICTLSVLQIPMPTGVPITLQTFAIALAGYVLGPILGASCAALYLLLGLIGVPCYAGFSSGPGVLFGVTGGFIWGFILMALLAGFGKKQTKGFHFAISIALGILGLAICHALGVVQFAIVAKSTLKASFLLVSVPYIAKDVVSVIGAKLVSIAINKALSNLEMNDSKARA
jgi:biotin transport system substrate-specific component